LVGSSNQIRLDTFRKQIKNPEEEST